MFQYKLLLRFLFRAELREYRKRNGKTQEEMAEELHISPRSYSDLERGKYAVSAATMMFFLAMLPAERMVEVVQAFVLQTEEANENAQIA